MSSALNGDRLLALRQLLGITQSEMAAHLDVSGGFLSHVTQGRRNFPESLARAASENYQVPYSFFLVQTEPADVGPVTFRKTSKARTRDENRVMRLYTEAARLFRHTSHASGYHEANLPDPVDYSHDPELLAAAVRQRAGLAPPDPVRNVTRLCERLGVGVVHELDPGNVDESEHSGASRPTHFSNRPLLALASKLPPAVKRLTLAHELFHIIADRDLDKPLTSRRDQREKRAYRFAAALLLPPVMARERISETMTLQGYLRVKADYGISVGALIHRADDLDLVPHQRARSLYIQWSSQGWRTNEPVAVADERPLLLGQALERSHGASYAAKASHDLGVPAELISRWVGSPARDDGQVAQVVSLDAMRQR
jgi:Zn-dependent peptidase ImmA (M78 family)/transcriptional regulator with XRE-family HTH domain